MNSNGAEIEGDSLQDWILNVLLPLQADQSGDQLRVVSVDILETFRHPGVHQALQT